MYGKPNQYYAQSKGIHEEGHSRRIVRLVAISYGPGSWLLPSHHQYQHEDRQNHLLHEHDMDLVVLLRLDFSKSLYSPSFQR